MPSFNTVGGEYMADPMFADGRADMFFSAPEADQEAVAALGCGRGRRLAFRLLEG